VSGPTRGSVEGRVYLDLQNKARRAGDPTLSCSSCTSSKDSWHGLPAVPTGNRSFSRVGCCSQRWGPATPPATSINPRLEGQSTADGPTVDTSGRTSRNARRRPHEASTVSVNNKTEAGRR
jgi:hypothetical protein